MKVNNQEEFILFADRSGISVLKCLFLLTFFNKCVRGYHFYSIFAKNNVNTVSEDNALLVLST